MNRMRYGSAEITCNSSIKEIFIYTTIVKSIGHLNNISLKTTTAFFYH